MKDRVAIITGASSGIGAATAEKLSHDYRGLILHARKSVEELEAIASAVRRNDCEVVTILCDLTDENIGERLSEAARARFGQLDAVIANAGFPVLKSFDEGSFADIDRAFRGNAFSFFSLVKATSDMLSESHAGRIVAVGSFTAHVFRTDMRQFPLSAASKGALETAVRSLAMHLAPKDITVNCVVPGYIRKDVGTEDAVPDAELASNKARIPLGRIGQPNEVAAAIRFLASPEAGYITGQSLHVNGGLAM